MKGAEYTIKGSAKIYKSTEKEVCQYYSQEYNTLVKNLAYSKNKPLEYKALTKE